MKYVPSLTALALASAAVIAIAAPEGAGGPHRGAIMERIKQADTDGNGSISRDEAKALPMIAKHFDEIDTDRNGQISPDELRAFHEKMRAEHDGNRAQRMAEHWKKLDTDGDGKVSLAEAKANAPRLAEHFSEIDANGDGFITPEEMKAAHHGHHGRAGK
jgi:Ca2+-binding EF-hand superfamily protein